MMPNGDIKTASNDLQALVHNKKSSVNDDLIVHRLLHVCYKVYLYPHNAIPKWSHLYLRLAYILCA